MARVGWAWVRDENIIGILEDREEKGGEAGLEARDEVSGGFGEEVMTIVGSHGMKSERGGEGTGRVGPLNYRTHSNRALWSKVRTCYIPLECHLHEIHPCILLPPIHSTTNTSSPQCQPFIDQSFVITLPIATTKHLSHPAPPLSPASQSQVSQ